jgi:hypothetical protein
MATTKIRSSSIEDGQVSNADLSATVAVTGGQIADDAVTLAKMADGTQGDTLYYGAAGAPTLLAKPGTPADEVLTFATGASAPSWAAAAVAADNTPSFCAYNDAIQNLAPAVYVLVAANQEVYDTDNGYDTGTYIYTIPTTGKYFVFCGCNVAHSSGYEIASLRVAIYKDGVLADGLFSSQSFYSTARPRWTTLYASTVLSLSAGDELKWYVYSDENVGGGQYVQLLADQYNNSWGAFKLAGV